MWTITVELQFYLLVPFIYLLLDKLKWRRWALIGLVLTFLVVNQYCSYLLDTRKVEGHILLFAVSFSPHIYMFLLGMLIQRNFGTLVKYFEGKFFYFLAVHMLVSIVVYLSPIRLYWGDLFNPLSTVTLIMLVLSFAYSFTDKLSDLLKGNDISYGVYIYHMIFVNLFLELSIFSSYVNVGVTFVVTLLTAYCSWRFIERPALSLKNYSVRR